MGSPDHFATNAPERSFLEDFAITAGDAGTDNGGGVLTIRDLRVARAALSGNNARRGSAISSTQTGSFSSGSDIIVEVIDTTVAGNTGALPLYLHDARISSTSLINNIATIGTNGGAGEFIRLHLENSTVSGNHASATGAFFASQAIVDSSTIYGNSSDGAPGGVFLLNRSVFRNSVIANNLVLGVADNCSVNPDDITSMGHNLTDTDALDCMLADASDVTVTDPLVGALGDNFGPTLTHLPAAGSPLIDSGDAVNCPARDQRGLLRPQDGDQNGSFVCDIGAVEVPEPTLVVGLVVGSICLVGCAADRRFKARFRPSPRHI